jgi:cysteine desulfurase
VKQLIYADNAATTQLDIDAFEAMKPYLLGEYGNASQPYSFARTAKKALKNSREIIAQCIGAQPEEIFFTSGGTESNNWAIKGIAFSDPVKHAFITSVIEHHAILRPCADIERMGHPVSYLPVDYTGTVNIETLAENINSDTRLVSVMTANNEIGSVQDIPALAAIAHSCGAIFHTDAVQAVGHIEIDVNLLGVDMLSASAHKFNGPKGIGFLYVRKGTPLMSYASGGGQEHHMRAGTENVASIVGMATALKKNVATMKDTASHLALLENRLLVGLSNANIRFTRNGSEVHIPGNISLSFPGYSGEAILHRLDLMGICVSTGSACNSQETQISHVLQAIGLKPELAKGTIRLSFGRNNSENDVDIIIESLRRILG